MHQKVCPEATLKRQIHMKEKKDEKLIDEIQVLRTEVKQLKEMVNMLVEIVVDMEGDDDDFGVDFEVPLPGKSNRPSFCM